MYGSKFKSSIHDAIHLHAPFIFYHKFICHIFKFFYLLFSFSPFKRYIAYDNHLFFSSTYRFERCQKYTIITIKLYTNHINPDFCRNHLFYIIHWAYVELIAPVVLNASFSIPSIHLQYKRNRQKGACK